MNYPDPGEPALHWLDIIEDDELLQVVRFYHDFKRYWHGVAPLEPAELVVGQKIVDEAQKRGLEWD